MIRIIIILIIAILILGAILFPKFRRSLWGTLVVVLCALAAIIWFDDRQRTSQDKWLPIKNIDVVQIETKPGLNAHTYVVNGRIRNRSEDITTKMILLQITLKDCIDQPCQIVGQKDRRIFLEVPPGQSRDFAATIPFTSVVNLKGEAEWDIQGFWRWNRRNDFITPSIGVFIPIL